MLKSFLSLFLSRKEKEGNGINFNASSKSNHSRNAGIVSSTKYDKILKQHACYGHEEVTFSIFHFSASQRWD